MAISVSFKNNYYVFIFDIQENYKFLIKLDLKEPIQCMAFDFYDKKLFIS